MIKKIWEFIKKVGTWVIYSSKNVNELSLTIKGLLYAIIPVVLLVLNAYKIQVDNVYLTTIIDQIIAIIIIVGGAITAVATSWGALRKLYTTATGTNAVVNSFK